MNFIVVWWCLVFLKACVKKAIEIWWNTLCKLFDYWSNDIAACTMKVFSDIILIKCKKKQILIVNIYKNKAQTKTQILNATATHGETYSIFYM